MFLPSRSWIFPGLFSRGRTREEGGEQPTSPAILSSVIFFSILNFFWVKKRALQTKFALAC